MSDKSPVVIQIDYHDKDQDVEQCIDDADRTIDNHELTRNDKNLIKTFPTVYIIREIEKRRGKTSSSFREKKKANSSDESDADELVYVGETNSIVRRTKQHYSEEAKHRSQKGKDAWKQINESQAKMLVIAHRHFNKSMTLDLEDRLLGYLLASNVDSVRVINDRGNPQDNYYPKEELDKITRLAWRKLNKFDSKTFLAESVIRDSAIFKASPFHALGPDQLVAEDAILERIWDRLEQAGKPVDDAVSKDVAGVEDSAGSAGDAEHEGADGPIREGELIIVEGAAGTGKTVLLSHLFLRLMNDLAEDGSESSAVLLVNHDEQLTVYNAIMKRLGLQNKDGMVVMKPTEFINKHSRKRFEKGLDHQDFPARPVDVALVDEAHLLLTSGSQGYRGSKNMLVDIMKRARVVIAVYDLNQVLRHSQEMDSVIRATLFPEGRYKGESCECARRSGVIRDFPFRVTNFKLHHQFRIDACDEVIEWIDNFASGKGIGPIPRDRAFTGHQPYSIKVFDSPFKLKDAIDACARNSNDSSGDGISRGLSRVLATYDWRYTGKPAPGGGTWEVRIYREHNTWIALNGKDGHDAQIQEKCESAPAGGVDAGSQVEYFHMPWNYQTKPTSDEGKDKAWAEQSHTLNECGSIYTIQGFDLNVAGVILGPSVCWREGHLVFDPSESWNKQATEGAANKEENLRHELNVLLKRGVHGLYLFAVDSELEEHLLKMQEATA